MLNLVTYTFATMAGICFAGEHRNSSGGKGK